MHTAYPNWIFEVVEAEGAAENNSESATPFSTAPISSD
jgi:hypothetical protein